MPLWRGGAAPVHRPAGSSEAGARGQQIGAAEEVERPEAATRERGIGYVAIKDVVDDQLQPETVVDIEADGPVDQRIGADVIDRSILRSEEHTSELQSLMRISYAVFCLKKKNKIKKK